METGFDYLASPYMDPDPLVREYRFLAAAKAVRELLLHKIWIFSPIVHCHELSKLWGMPPEAAFWQEYDAAMIRACRNLRVLRLPGWARSVGVAGELKYAAEIGRPVIFHDPETLFDAASTVEINSDLAQQAAKNL